MPGVSSDAIKRSVAAARGAGGGAFGAGSSVGGSMGDGVASGISSRAGAAEAAARALVDRAKRAMQAFAKIFSPSRLFADDIGAPIAEGVAAGISSAAPSAATAAADLVALAAASAAAQSATQTIPLPPVTFAPGTAAAANAAATAASLGPAPDGRFGGGDGGDLIIEQLNLTVQTSEPITEEGGAAFGRGFQRTVSDGTSRFRARTAG